MAHVAIYWHLITKVTVPVPLLQVDLLEFVRMSYVTVPVFYILSGYLLTWTEEGRKRRGSYNVLNYAKRRALRIVPVYYAAIALYVLLPLPGPSLDSIVLHLTFLQGFKPSYPAGFDSAWWSLTPEVVFYAALPLLVLKFPKFWQRATILGVLLSISLITRLSIAEVFSFLPTLDVSSEVFGRNRMYFFPTNLLYLFLVGMLLRMMVERHADAGRQPSNQQLLLASALSVVPIALLSVFPYLIMTQREVLSSPWAFFGEAMVILIFVSILLGSPVLRPILGWRPVVFFGEISYSLFLLHSSVIFGVIGAVLLAVSSWSADPSAVFAIPTWVANQSGPTIWAIFLTFTFVVLVTSVPLAYLSYRYIESPFMRIKPKK
jgi:peptidoglycan/LPS O-acetylase OafA/YrhL